MRVWRRAHRRFARTLAYESGRTLATLATWGHSRRPVAWLHDLVFLGMAEEFERQGLSRKVAADMFGMTLRTYQRHVGAARDLESDGVNLWHKILSKLREPASRETILGWFSNQRALEVNSILADMVDSGWAHISPHGLYRVEQQGTPWTDAMVDEYLMVCAAIPLGRTVDLEQFERETGVPRHRWSEGNERYTPAEVEYQRVTQEDSVHSILRQLALHMMKILRRTQGHKGTFWVIPVTPDTREDLEALNSEIDALYQEISQILQRHQGPERQDLTQDTQAYIFSFTRGLETLDNA